MPELGPRLGRTVGIAAVAASLWALAPAEASAAEPTRPVFEPRRDFFQAFEVHGILTGQMMPRPFFGFDGAYAIGNEYFQARIGAGINGSPAWKNSGDLSVSNIIYSGLLDVCATKSVVIHRVRMCVGGEGGFWQHFWSGESYREQKRISPHVAGTMKADYQYSITRRIGVILGAGVSIPVIGPSFQGRDQYDRPTTLTIPGPIAGHIRLGASLRI